MKCDWLMKSFFEQTFLYVRGAFPIPRTVLYEPVPYFPTETETIMSEMIRYEPQRPTTYLLRAVWLQSSLSACRNFAVLAIQNAQNEDSDLTVRMRRLIWVFAGRTYRKVRFMTLRFKSLLFETDHERVNE